MKDLSEARTEIDALDEQIMALIGRRLDVCRGVAVYKMQHDMPMMQPARVDAVKNRCAAMGETHGVDGTFTRNLYGLIIGEACRIEDEIMERPGGDG